MKNNCDLYEDDLKEYEFQFGQCVKVKSGFYKNSYGIVRRFDQIKDNDDLMTLYGVVMIDDPENKVVWFKPRALEAVTSSDYWRSTF